MRHETLPICLALTSLLLGLYRRKPPAQPRKRGGDTCPRFRSTSVMYSAALLPDIYPFSPEVVRYDRYRLVDISPSQAQRFTRWNKFVHLRISCFRSPRRSGMRYVMPCVIPGLSSVRPMDRRTTFYRLPLPAVSFIQDGIDPPGDVALQILVGPAAVVGGWCAAGSVLPTSSGIHAICAGCRNERRFIRLCESPHFLRAVRRYRCHRCNTSTGHTDVNKVHRGGWLKWLISEELSVTPLRQKIYRGWAGVVARNALVARYPAVYPQ